MTQTIGSPALQIQAQVTRRLELLKKDQARRGKVRLKGQWRKGIKDPEAYAAAIKRYEEAGLSRDDVLRSHSVKRLLKRNHDRGVQKKAPTLPKLKFMEGDG